MVHIAGQKFACATCIKGHRSSSCNHTDRPLFAIRPKGRPVSQCEHCRELRKTKQVHVKCECDNKTPGAVINGGAETQMIVARKGARKIKTLEPATATFPNGIQDIVEAATLLSGMSGGDASGTATTPICTCGQGGACNCCTDRYVSKKSKGEGSSSKGHGNRPSISLTIPPNSEGGPSSPASGHHGRSPSITLTPSHNGPGSRSHSRSPSRSAQHHAVDGHSVGGSQADHLANKHAALYSPYSAGPGLPYGLPADLRSPTSSGTNSHQHSPGGPSSTAPTSASPILLLPSGGIPYEHDLSNPNSPLSVDLDRPHSSLSLHTGSGGRSTPIDFAVIPGTPNNHVGEWGSPHTLSPSNGLGDGMQAMNLMSGSPVLGSPLDQYMAQSQQVAFTSYRQQDTLSPGSPGTPHYLIDPNSAQPSPTNFAPSDMGQFGMGGYSDPFQQQTPMGAMQSLMQEGNAFGAASGRLSPYSDVFEEGDSQDLSGILGGGQRSRRGSHQSVSSTHSAGHLAPEIRLMSASPIPPQGSMPELNLADMALMDPESVASGGRVCANAPNGTCHCWSPNGSPGEICGGMNCPCCNYVSTARGNATSLAALGLDALMGSANKFALSTEREAGLQIPAFQNRSRSSSSSSHTSSHSHVSSPIITTPNTGASSLSRANSTGQIGRGKFKPILPKPTHGTSASMSYQSGFAGLSLQPTGRTVQSNPVSAGPSSPSVLMPYQNQFQGGADGGNAGMNFTFPRPRSAEDLNQQSPAVIVTEPPANDFNLDANTQESFKQMMQASFGGAPSSPSQQDPFAFDPSSNSSSSSLFEAAAAAAMGNAASARHSRNHSQPTSTFGAASSPFLQEPKPMHFGHGRSSSTSLLDARSSIEVLVTPPSPFNPPPSTTTGAGEPTS